MAAVGEASQQPFPGEGSWRSRRPSPLPDAEPGPRAEQGWGRGRLLLRSPQRGRRGPPRDEAWPAGGDDGAPRWPSRPLPEGSEWWGRSPRQQEEEEEEGARWGPPGRKRQKRPWGSPGREAPEGGAQPELRGGRWRSWSGGRRSPSVGPGSPPRRPQSPRGDGDDDPPRGWGSPRGEPGPSSQGLRGGRWSGPERRGRRRRQRPQASGRRQAEPKGTRSPDGDWGDPGWEPRQEGPQGWEPFQGGRSESRGRWSSPEKRGGQPVGPGSPERLRRQPGPGGDPRDWGDPEGPKSWACPATEWFDPGGSWSSPEGRRGGRQSPGEQRAWGSPTRGEGQEGSGRFGSPKHFDSEQGPVNWGGLTLRGAQARVLSHAGSSHRLQSSKGGQQQGSRTTLFRGGWDPEEAGLGSCERGGKEEDGADENEGGPKGSGSLAETAAGIPGAPLERWTPREAVAQYWVHCQAILSKQMRRRLLSACPQPALPNRMAEVPCLNKDITLLLNARDLKELGAASRPLWGLQEELLEMLGPAMTIHEMAEEAMETQEAVDAMELQEWTRRLIRYIGSLNQRLTAQRRMQALGAINPRLKCVTSKMASLCPDGKLFAEDKVQLLKEIIQRFPQLTEAKRKVPQKVSAFLQPGPKYGRLRVEKVPFGASFSPLE